MPLGRVIVAGAVASVALFAFAVLFFFQYKDPMILIFGVRAILGLWVILLIVHLMRRGIPVRVVGEERKP